MHALGKSRKKVGAALFGEYYYAYPEKFAPKRGYGHGLRCGAEIGEHHNYDSASVKELAEFMQSQPDIHPIIEGYASAPCVADYNKALSIERALVVKKLFVDNYNIDADRLATVGYSETR